MPVLRYFVVVGTALMVLVFAVDAYLPKLPAADNAHTAANAASDISVIRIHSVQKWPARVEFDTSLPTIMPAAPVLAANNVPADATAPARMREAFAQLQTTQVQTTQVQTSELQTAEPKKPELKAAALIARTGEMLTNPGSSADSSSNSLATSEPSVG